MPKPIVTVHGERDDVLYVVDEARGVYCPQKFCEKFDFDDFTGIDRDDWDTVLDGPDEEFYWHCWATICRDAVGVFDPSTFSLYGGKVGDGKRFIKYTIYQDGGIFLVPEGVCMCGEKSCENCNPPEEEEDAA